MKDICRCILLILFCGITHDGMCDVSDESTQELQLMLSEIQQELDHRGVTMAPKNKGVRSQFSRIIDNTSWRNVAIGSVLTAAVTAHPAGLLVGGVAGGMIDKVAGKKKPSAHINKEGNKNELKNESQNYSAPEPSSMVNNLPDDKHKIAPPVVNITTKDITTKNVATLQAMVPPFSSGRKPINESLEPSLEPSLDQRQEPVRRRPPPKKIMPQKITQPSAQHSTQHSTQQQAHKLEQQLEQKKEPAVQSTQDILASCYDSGASKTRKRPAHCFYMVY